MKEFLSVYDKIADEMGLIVIDKNLLIGIKDAILNKKINDPAVQSKIVDDILQILDKEK